MGIRRKVEGFVPDEIIDVVCDSIRVGNYAVVAAQSAGMRKETYYAWVRRAKKDLDEGKESSYTKFYHAVKEAEADAEKVLVKIVSDAARVDARHAHWLLARRHPERWGKEDKVRVAGADGGPLNIQLSWGDEKPDAEDDE